MTTNPKSRLATVAAALLLSLLLILTIAACRQAAPPSSSAAPPATPVIEQVEVTVVVSRVVEVTPPPAASGPIRPKDLVICMAEEPDTLYPYGSTMLASRAVQHAIFENTITNLSYGYQAQSLEKLPSLADGDAVIREIEVQAGDVVVTADGQVKALSPGDVVIAADGQAVAFDGTPVVMEQLVVDFVMKPTVYADGTPVRAADSVFSYALASDPETPVAKDVIARTSAYEATGDLTTRWTGLPGYRSSTYFLNFWPPYPQHLWGDYSAAELLMANEARLKPIGDGPFRLVEWIAGNRIRLVKNPYYYRAAEGLPRLDSLTFKFVPDPDQMLVLLLSGQCHIATSDGVSLDQAAALMEAKAAGRIVPHFQTGTIYEHIDFNINPYGDYAESRYDWFDDVDLRRAMTLCTDRQGMVDAFLFGQSEVMNSYIPSVHPLYPAEGLQVYPFDAAAGNALLDAAGYDRRDADGFRLDPSGKRFAPRLGTTAGSAIRRQIVDTFRENMAACGIDIQPYYMPASDWYADGPDGELFGRRYDLGAFAWSTGVQPACETYTGGQIPGPAGEANEITGGAYTGWRGLNQTGYYNPDYDAACLAAASALPGTSEYVEAHREAQIIFSQDLPIIPLFQRIRVAATQPSVLNFRLDPTQTSELYNLYEIDLRQQPPDSG